MNWEKLLSEQRIRKSSKKDPNQALRKDIRNEFESDLGRIIYSPALRRMHDKTQVFPLTTDDNIHTRLTHSNEVMSLGYTFGLKCAISKKIQDRTNKTESELFRIIPVILQSVCLIHDIGNPPFGHFAEDIIANYFNEIKNNPFIPKDAISAFENLDNHQKNDFIHFDGNAQGLRVVTKLQYLDDIFGLNLTYSILGSYLKYPNYYAVEISNDKRKELKKRNIGQGKHGVFYSEKGFYEKIVKECILKKASNETIRHPLCFLMEAADSIAYRVMDIEDGFSKKYVTIEDFEEAFYKSSSGIAKEILKICSRKDCNDGNKIVFIRIKLIDYLVNLAFENFETNLEKIEKGTYHKELIEDDENGIDEILKKICATKIFNTREINYLETTGYSVITGLLNHYISQLFHSKKGFSNRSLPLISCSIREVALEEDLQNIIENKYKKITNDNFTESQQSNYKKLKQKIEDYIQEIKSWESQEEIDHKEWKRLKKEILEDFQDLDNAIDFTDLSDYYKFRVIVDFISGMTDKFALTHYQKISGQKID